MSHTAYLSLGSNLGDRTRNIETALAKLQDDRLQITGRSAFYETEPLELVEQPWFINIVVVVRTTLSALEVLGRTRAVEEELGRERVTPKGPRIIDIDIILFDLELIDLPELQIPHPRMHQRRFVLQPLLEIAPDLRHPRTGRSIADLLTKTELQKVRLLR